MKICLIDDNPEILEVIKNILEATDNEVFTSTKGREGLAMILDSEFKMVILDITMLEFSGINIVRHLDNVGKLKDSNVLFLTAAAIPDSELQGWIVKGVKVCLRKPVEFNVLFEHVMEAKIA